ncbi:MAG: cobalamin B12-binding domain-containing protein [Desulfomonilia bacterium]
MDSDSDSAHRIHEALRRHDAAAIVDLLNACNPERISSDITGNLLEALEQQRLNLMSNALSLPEFLLTIDTVNACLETIRNLGTEVCTKNHGIRVVIGVVQGDPHDLGKNIITGLYRAHGYEVHDLGRSVPKDAFLHTLMQHDAQILALSAMMSTTMPFMKEIIHDVRVTGRKVAVILGGAPLDAATARSYGADGYAQSARSAIEETEEAFSKVFG